MTSKLSKWKLEEISKIIKDQNILYQIFNFISCDVGMSFIIHNSINYYYKECILNLSAFRIDVRFFMNNALKFRNPSSPKYNSDFSRRENGNRFPGQNSQF